MPKATLSAALHGEYSAKLEQLLDNQDDVREKRQRIAKALGGELKIIADQIARTRRVLKGIEGPQQEIPGTEIGERKRDAGVLAVLAAAGKVAAREEAKAKKAAGPTKAAQLVWRLGVDDRTWLAEATGGKYELLANGTRWDLRWLTKGKDGIWLGGSLHRDEAEQMAESHLLERAGDAILENAGAGGLATSKGRKRARHG